MSSVTNENRVGDVVRLRNDRYEQGVYRWRLFRLIEPAQIVDGVVKEWHVGRHVERHGGDNERTILSTKKLMRVRSTLWGWLTEEICTMMKEYILQQRELEQQQREDGIENEDSLVPPLVSSSDMRKRDDDDGDDKEEAEVATTSAALP